MKVGVDGILSALLEIIKYDVIIRKTVLWPTVGTCLQGYLVTVDALGGFDA